jgi:hypothetical protein
VALNPSRSTQSKWARFTLCSLVAVLLLLSFFTAAPSQVVASRDADLMVLVHPDTPKGALGRSELQAVFLRRRLAWSDGTRIVPFNYVAGDDHRTTFDRIVLGFTPEQAARYWIDARIRSGTEAPRTLTSASLVARVVMQLRGSIGYVPADQVPEGALVVARITKGQVTEP